MSMTSREFLNAIINANLSDEITNHASELLVKMDARNSARSAKPSKVAIANEPIKEAILAQLRATPDKQFIASEIAEMNGISVNKASALLRQLVEAGFATSITVSVPKKGKCNAYLAVEEGKEEG